MKISVVIPNYNGIDFLVGCLKSLENESERENSHFLNVIIVDNCSNDGSLEYIKDKIKDNHDHSSNNKTNLTDTNLNNINYHLISNGDNLGFSKAVNQGIEIANSQNSEYLCLLNNDVEVESGFIHNLLKPMKNDEKTFSVASKMLQYHNRDIIDDAGDEYTLLGWTKKSGDGISFKNYSKSREIFSSCAGAALYRVSILNEIGYFDENFFAYMEDVDIGYRAIINGYKTIYSPDAIVYHVGSGSSGSRYNEFKIKLAARNNILVVYKNMPWPQILFNIGFLFLGFLIKYLFFVKKGHGNIYLKGLKEGISNRKKLKKTEFKFSNIKNYFRIEWKLIVNMFKLLTK